MIESQESGPQPESRDGSWMVVISVRQDQVLIVPGRRKAPHPSKGRVTIRWKLAGQRLEWDEDGIEMKEGWDEEWGLPMLDEPANEYVLIVEEEGPADKRPYPYTTRVLLDGDPVEIDPEVEYDSDFA